MLWSVSRGKRWREISPLAAEPGSPPGPGSRLHREPERALWIGLGCIDADRNEKWRISSTFFFRDLQDSLTFAPLEAQQILNKMSAKNNRLFGKLQQNVANIWKTY